MFKDLGKLAKKAKLDKPDQLVKEIGKHPEKVAQDAARTVGSGLQHIDGRQVGRAVEDTSEVVLKEVVPKVSGQDLERIKQLEKVLEKATPELLKELSKTDPDKVEQVFRDTDPNKILDLVDKLNTGQRYLSHWPYLLAGALGITIVLYCAARQMHFCMLRRRPKIWAQWAPQNQVDTQLSVWSRSGGSDLNDAEQPWITADEQSSFSAL